MKNFFNFGYYWSSEPNVLKPINYFFLYNLLIYIVVYYFLYYSEPGFWNSIDRKTSDYYVTGVMTLIIGYYLILPFTILCTMLFSS